MQRFHEGSSTIFSCQGPDTRYALPDLVPWLDEDLTEAEVPRGEGQIGKRHLVADEPLGLLRGEDPSRTLRIRRTSGLSGSLGIDLSVLKSLQQKWASSFNWATEQAALNE